MFLASVEQDKEATETSEKEHENKYQEEGPKDHRLEIKGRMPIRILDLNPSVLCMIVEISRELFDANCHSSTHLCHLIRSPYFLGEEDWNVAQERQDRIRSGRDWLFGT